jgi:tRNA pseudouridine55 synthase
MIITEAAELKNADFLAGVTLLVDKPLGWTSFDVVNKIRFLLRKKLGVKKIKVGHAGTLDPLATGLLIIGVGKDTKKIEAYQDLDKHYSGALKLGASTASYDAEFEPDVFFPVDHITEDLIEKARQQFLGVITQVPPAFSAIKVKGKRAYQLARAGKEAILKERRVEIYSFDLDPSDFPLIQFEVRCQKGTYIRSLAYDFGQALQSGAFLTSLRRTAIGSHQVDEAFDLETLIEVLS